MFAARMNATKQISVQIAEWWGGTNFHTVARTFVISIITPQGE
jgi:hypothetical protein